MKISIANNPLTAKPKRENGEMAKYMKKLVFKSGDFPQYQFKDIIKNGYTITYLFKDSTFTRQDHYMTNNYVGTQFICVDVDKVDVDAQTFAESLKFKPTIIHTTFSNLTCEKDFKHCFHLIYCFDKVIEGEQNFTTVFQKLTSDYEEYVDSKAKDCHRVIFTTNSNLQNFQYIENDVIYKVSDFVNKEYCDFNTFFNSDCGCLKNDCLDKSNTSNNLSSEKKNRQSENDSQKHIKNSFNLDSEFFSNLNSMNRSDFIRKYELEFPYITHTMISEESFINGYADVRDIDYYVVPSAQYIWNPSINKGEVRKVTNGNRNTMLFIDAIAFMKIIPNITKEYLVYLLVTEVYKNFINGDGELSNWFIINKAKEVWENIDNLSLKPIKKSFVIDKNYWLEKGKNNWLEVARIIRKEMKSNTFGEFYDFNCSVEENIKYFKEYGINTKKQTLVKWLQDNNLDYYTDKEYRNRRIIELYKENNKLSSRQIERMLKDEGIKVGKDTIIKVINDNKDCLKINSLNKSNSHNNLSRQSKNRQSEIQPQNLCDLQKYFIDIFNKERKYFSKDTNFEELNENLLSELEKYNYVGGYKNIYYMIEDFVDNNRMKYQPSFAEL